MGRIEKILLEVFPGWYELDLGLGRLGKIISVICYLTLSLFLQILKLAMLSGRRKLAP
jgi:hypothetical protein